jgi:hypothetical protein
MPLAREGTGRSRDADGVRFGGSHDELAIPRGVLTVADDNGVVDLQVVAGNDDCCCGIAEGDQGDGLTVDASGPDRSQVDVGWFNQQSGILNGDIQAFGGVCEYEFIGGAGQSGHGIATGAVVEFVDIGAFSALQCVVIDATIEDG